MWISPSAFTAKTSPSTIPLGIDRSTPAVAITKVVPTLTTVRIATFWASCRKFDQVSNWPGALIANPMIIAESAANVTMTVLRVSRWNADSVGSTATPAPSSGAPDSGAAAVPVMRAV